MQDRVGKGYSLSLNLQKRGRHARVCMWVSVFKETNFRAGSENIFLPQSTLLTIIDIFLICKRDHTAANNIIFDEQLFIKFFKGPSDNYLKLQPRTYLFHKIHSKTWKKAEKPHWHFRFSQTAKIIQKLLFFKNSCVFLFSCMTASINNHDQKLLWDQDVH